MLQMLFMCISYTRDIDIVVTVCLVEPTIFNEAVGDTRADC